MGMGGNIGGGIQNWQRNVYGGQQPYMGGKGGGKAGGSVAPNRSMGPAGSYTPTASKAGGTVSPVVDQVINRLGGLGQAMGRQASTANRPFAQPEMSTPWGPRPVNPYAGPGMFGGGNISQDSPVYNPAAPQPTNQPEAPAAPKSMGSHYDLASQLFDQYKAGEMGMNEGDLGWLRQRGYLNPVYGPNSEDNMDPTGFQFDLNNAEARKWLQGKNYSF